MKRKVIFFLVAALLLVPWPVAYAYGNNSGDRPTVGVSVEAAAAAAAPRYSAYGNAIGGVAAGDLFYVDTVSDPADLPVTLYLTNTDELVHSYRYMTLNVGVYSQTGDGQWQKLAGDKLPDTYITLSNGKVDFTLPGHARYKITIDRGCFYHYGNAGSGSQAAPSFYLTAG